MSNSNVPQTTRTIMSNSNVSQTTRTLEQIDDDICLVEKVIISLAKLAVMVVELHGWSNCGIYEHGCYMGRIFEMNMQLNALHAEFDAVFHDVIDKKHAFYEWEC
jgi:hypothetical protein